MIKGIKDIKTVDDTVLSPTPEPRYRYSCEGCTNTALETTNTMVGVFITCGVCGKVQQTKPENYIIK